MNESFKNFGKRVGELGDLPEELLNNLQIAKTDELEESIIAVIDELYDGMANLDEIMVGLYRQYGLLVENRQFLSNKMYRMSQNKHIHSVNGKKGAYTTKADLVDFFKNN